MNKQSLVKAVANNTGLKNADAKAAVEAVFDAITEAAKNGEGTQLVGFGSFEVKERPARTGRNPKTGEAIEIPASKSLTFKAGKAVKEAL